jgi:hypothetical protein
VSTQPAGAPVADRTFPGSTAASQWAQIHAVSPQVVATMQRYLQRLAAFQAPTSVDVAENTLRIFAGWMLGAGLHSVAAVRRDQIEDFKVWLATNRTRGAGRSRPRRIGSGCGWCARSSSGSSSGIGPTPRHATR